MSFKKLNDLVGWIIFAIATVVYVMTAEQVASFWDCGEFIAVSYKLMVPHPPGAPFFLLVGRLFSMLAMGDGQQVGYWVNMVSVLSSSFTILFMFWSITLLGRKLVGAPENDGQYSLGQQLALLGASTIGSLAYTFSDSFWFSAVEAEVYGMSSFFTAFVVWAMLKWETLEDAVDENKWLLLIAYMMGLSIGVHLLNLVTLPAMGLVYYFKKYKTPTFGGIVATLLLSLVIIGIIMEGIIPGLPTLAGKLEIMFVNSFGLPFGSGIVLFIALCLGGLVYGIRYAVQHNKVILHTSLMSLVFILIGYSSYSLVLIRSNANPPIDENNPEDIISFVSYLRREQYGDRPLLYGRTFKSDRLETVYGDSVYRKGKNRYESYDIKMTMKYSDNMLLPRIYSQTDDHAQLYRSWLNLPPNEEYRPGMGDNLRFLFTYQLGHMYFRYFLWNFAGRDGDDKEAAWLLPWSPTGAPEEIAKNRARDNFYMLPLILGLVGMFYQLKKDEKGFSFAGMLFVLTGVALVVYMNSPPTEPRERDYIYVGSFYAFAMWIGLGVLALADALRNVVKNPVARPVIATAVCAVVPLLMGTKGWDNHNRHGRFHSVDQARNTLASCAPNAILFTGGDNDTFPLWYVQDVEGFRTDVRVIVLSYFNTDWYVDQMRRKVYESDALPFSLEWENYKSGKNDIVYVDPNAPSDRALNLRKYLSYVKENNPAILRPYGEGEMLTISPSRSFSIGVDSAGVIAKGIIPKGKEQRVLSQMTFGLRKGSNAFYKSDLMILDLLANFNWNRPVYFNNTSASTTAIDLRDYLFMEGMTYRLLPIRARGEGGMGEVSTEVMYANLKKFQFRGFDNPDAYHDEEYRKFAANERNAFFRLALQYYEDGNDQKAKEVLDYSLKNIPDSSIPYDYYMPQYAQLYYLLGETAKADQIAELMGKRAVDNLKFVVDHNLINYSYADRANLWLYTLNRLQDIYTDLVKREEANLATLRQTPEVDQEMGGKKVAEAEAKLKGYREKAARYADQLNNYYPKVNR
jgi:hypothetical protein